MKDFYMLLHPSLVPVVMNEFVVYTSLADAIAVRESFPKLNQFVAHKLHVVDDVAPFLEELLRVQGLAKLTPEEREALGV